MSFVCLALLALTPAEPNLTSDDGTVHLRWSEGRAEAYELEHVFEGERVSTRTGVTDFHLSGLREGEHRYRLRPVDQETWSDPISVTVRFPSRRLVVALLLVGAVLFAATSFAVLRGAQS